MDQPRLLPQIRAAIEEELQCVITKEKQKYDLEIDGLLGQKRTLEHKSEKLLEAHYNDAIPMGLLKAEQEKITKELAKLNRSIRANSEAAPAKIVTAKNRILKTLRCGLAACSDTRNMESYSNSNFFTYKSSSKELLVEARRIIKA